MMNFCVSLIQELFVRNVGILEKNSWEKGGNGKNIFAAAADFDSVPIVLSKVSGMIDLRLTCVSTWMMEACTSANFVTSSLNVMVPIKGISRQRMIINYYDYQSLAICHVWSKFQIQWHLEFKGEKTIDFLKKYRRVGLKFSIVFPIDSKLMMAFPWFRIPWTFYLSEMWQKLRRSEAFGRTCVPWNFCTL